MKLALTISGTPIPLPSGVPTQNLSTILSWAIELLTIIGIIMALGFLIYAGVQWVTSEGDKQKLQTARDSVKYTVLGLIIIFVSFLFINIIAYFFHIPLLGKTPTAPPTPTSPPSSLNPASAPSETSALASVVGTVTAVSSGVYNTITGAKGCNDSKTICSNQPDTFPVSLDDFYSEEQLHDNQGNPINFAADCLPNECTYPAEKIIFVYDQRETTLGINEQGEDEFKKYNCDKSGTNSPGGSTCGPTSLAMIAEAFNGPEVVNGERRYQTANNLSRFFLDRNLMRCTTGSLDQNMVSFLKQSTKQEIYDAFHLCIISPQYESFDRLETWYNVYGYPTWIGVWYAQDRANPAQKHPGSAHYVTLAGISNRYVWIADPHGPKGQYILRIEKEIFKNKYYREKYWEIFPEQVCKQYGY